jgi:tetratricopeptide (TPR) repeat protein
MTGNCKLYSQTAISALLLLIVGATVVAEDRVFPLAGGRVSGKITEATKDNIIIEASGKTQKFAPNDITRIQFDGEPQSLSRAKEFVSNGQLESAALEIKKVDPASLMTDDHKKEFAYYRWFIEGRLALIGKGDAAGAVKGLLAFAKENPQTFHFYEMTENLGNLASSLGNFDRAAVYFAALSKSPVREVQVRGKYLEGRSLLTQQKVPEAAKAFSDVAAASADTPTVARIKKLAVVGMARCDVVNGKAPEALGSLQKLVKENDSTDGELFANIYNAQGECLAKMEQNEGAVLAFLHTDLLFANQPDSHAEALYHLSSLWTKVGDPQRAADAKARLLSLYAGSSWAKK